MVLNVILFFCYTRIIAVFVLNSSIPENVTIMFCKERTKDREHKTIIRRLVRDRFSQFFYPS